MTANSGAPRVLVVTAVPAETDAVLAGFGGAEPAAVGPYAGRRTATPAGELVVLCGGVGAARAAACAATALALDRPSLVVSAGVAGGFAGRAAVGDLVVADAVVHADLGADSAAGFLPATELGLGRCRMTLRPDLVALAAERTGALVGAVLTVCTVTGSARRAAELTARHDAAAEAMEGAGVAAAAEAHGVPLLEVRAVSNPVGPRDRSAWDLPGALAALSRAFAELLRTPL